MRKYLFSMCCSCRPRAPLLLALSLLAPAGIAQPVLSEGTNIAVDVSRTDGRIALDLLGSIWVLPAAGGDAEQVENRVGMAARPRWSPDGESILFQSSSLDGGSIWLLDIDRRTSRLLSEGSSFDQHPEWHPTGERITFSSVANGDASSRGFDLWEMHLATGLRWRLSQHGGDETEPAWSSDGRHLVYVHRRSDQWRLVLRRHGQAERTLVVSDEPLAAPSWRPDGSLVTYLRQTGGSYRLEMVILSEPPLVRVLADDQDFFLAPVSWQDRMQYFYTADGVIKRRGFNEWRARKVPFRAQLQPLTPVPVNAAEPQPRAPLPIVSPSQQRLVIRGARLFDGVTAGYREDVDVLLHDGRIAAVENRRDRRDAVVLDLGDVTILPGFIDVYSELPQRDPRGLGAALLSFGVTTVVAHPLADFDPLLWEGDRSPGPRLLLAATLGEPPDDPESMVTPGILRLPATGLPAAPAAGSELAVVEGSEEESSSRVASDPRTGFDIGIPILAETWQSGRALGAGLLLGIETLPASPRGRRYRDLQLTQGAAGGMLLSGLADAATPGVSELLKSRQAQALERWLGKRLQPTRRFAVAPHLAHDARIAVGSKPNGLPAGIALHAELRALAAAGLDGDDVLWAAGAHAATALGFERQLGRISVGALADLVLVAGDPRERIVDALDVVAVVRNGRFYSLGRLLDEVAANGVE